MLLKKIRQWGDRELKISFLTFTSGILLGLLLVFIIQFNTLEFFKNLLKSHKDILDATVGGNYWLVVFSIFKQNLIAVSIIISLGLIYRFLPLAIVLFNGALLGVVVALASSLGLSVFKILSLILPHGSFELPAMILAGAIGMRLSRNKGFKGRLHSLINSKVPILIILLLLFVAALIESYSIISLS